MKKIFIIVLVSMVFASCADNTINGVSQHENPIAFTTYTPSARATMTVDNLKDFKVCAVHDDAYFLMENVTVSRSESNGAVKWIYDPITYWPVSGTVNFYARAWHGENPDNEGTSKVLFEDDDKTKPYIGHMSLDADADGVVTGRRDVAYAVCMNETKKTTPVQMFFRHATSQIVFQYRHSNPLYAGVQVFVEDIRIANLVSTGRYILPRETTSRENNVRGEWDLDFYADNYESIHTYDLDIVPMEVPYDDTGAVIPYSEVMADNIYTSSKGVDYEDDGHLNVIPQTVTPWNETIEGLEKGMYILVKVKYMQGEACLWPALKENETAAEAEPAWVAVPLTAPNNGWKEGYRYVYTLDLPGGIDISDETTEPEPVLVPIEFDVDVEPIVEFESNGDLDVDMDDYINA